MDNLVDVGQLGGLGQLGGFGELVNWVTWWLTRLPSDLVMGQISEFTLTPANLMCAWQLA